MAGRKPMPIIDRFLEKIVFIPFHECWEWSSSKNEKGYGKFLVNAEIGEIRAHRASLLLLCGVDAGAMLVLHRCDNPGCVRPEHLFLGTAKDNTQDMLAKGRQRGQFKSNDPRSNKGQWLSAKTKCLRGHEFTKENTRTFNGRRICRACAAERSRGYRSKIY